MDVKTEVSKALIAKIVAGVLVLIGLLLSIVFWESLSGVLGRAEAAITKRAVEALLALAVIAVCGLGAWVAYLGYAVWKLKRSAPSPEPKMLLIFALLWDGQQNPHCPVDKAPLFIFGHTSESEHGAYDMLKCPNCKQRYPIRSAHSGLMTLHDARNSIRDHLSRGILELL